MKAKLIKVAGIGTVLLFCSLFASTAFAQNIQFTQGSVGSGLDNTIQIPLQTYPGRGGTSLPVTLYYSSRVWRLNNLTPLTYQSYYQSVAEALYAEYSKSGWKTSLDLPIIEWPKPHDTYYYSGGPFCVPCEISTTGEFRVARVFIHMPDGSTHELRRENDQVYQGTIQKSGTFYAIDGSRIRFDSTGNSTGNDSTGTLYLPDGSRYILSGSTAQFIDRNGNTLNYNTSTRQWTDTLGRLVNIPLPEDPELLALNPDGTRTFTYTAKGIDNTEISYTLVWKNLSDALTPADNNQLPTRRVVGSEYLPTPGQSPNSSNNQPQSNQSQSLFTAGSPDGGVDTLVVGQIGKWAGQGQLFNPVVLTEVRLPNALSYKFSYNIYGEIDKVTYPTGAFEAYQYTGLPAIGETAAPYSEANRGVTSRKLSAKGDGSDIAEWLYSAATFEQDQTVPFNAYRISTTTPDLTYTEVYKHNLPAPLQSTRSQAHYWAFGFEDTRQGMVYDERVYAPGQNGQRRPMLRRKLTEWDKTNNAVPPRTQLPGDNAVTAYRHARPTKEVSIILDTGGSTALAKTMTYSYDTTYQMTTGPDLTASIESYFADIDQTTAQTGGITLTASNSTITISAGTPARSSLTCYLTKPADICSLIGVSVSSYDYISYNILGLPAVSVIKEGDTNGSVIAKTVTSYDEVSRPPIPYSGYSASDYTDPGQNVPRGMVTSTKRYFNITAGLFLETKAQYDQFGSLKVFTNERDQQTLTDYASNYKYAYATQVTTAAPDPSGQHGSTAGFTSSSTYDYTTGLVLTSTDAGGQTTAFSYRDEQNNLDPLNRLRKVTRPDGGWTKYTFNDVAGNLYAMSETKQDDTHTVKTYQYFDAMGRASRAFMSEGVTNNVQNYIVSDTKYDPLGRVCKASNPYRVQALGNISTTGDCVAAANWTTTTYDPLGRAKQVTLPDGTSVQTDYAGIYTTVTDQAGKQRRQKVDALGRIVRVDEPVVNGSLGTVDAPLQASYYDYDTLGNLVHIQQGAGSYIQNRYFKYDSLSRLTYERQVEQAATFTTADSLTGNSQWTRHIVYDENGYSGLVTSQYDARNIHTSLSYDNLNRITGISYDDTVTPQVSYFYDTVRFTNSQDTRTIYNLGRLVEVQTAALGSLPTTSQAYNFDLMGRVANNRQSVGTNSYSMIYTYNVGGALKSEQYPSKTEQNPSGRVVSYSYDDAARLSSVSSGGTTYASQFNYGDARGLLSSFTLGNGAVESYSYNSRLQLSSIQIAKNNTTLERYDYKYGQFNTSGTLDETKNNGQIAQIESYIGTAKQWQQQYEYDSLGRLKKTSEYQGSSTSSPTYQMNYDYDVFGNRYQKAADNPINPNDNLPDALPYTAVEDGQINKLTNRFTVGITDNDYDGAGNILRDIKFTGRQYLYDANNRQRQVAQLDGTGAVVSVYDGAGQRVATQTAGAVDNVLVYDVGGKLVAEYGQAPVNRGTSYVFTDHQGSTRVVMDSSGTAISRHDYQPYGEDIGAGIGLRTTGQFYGQGDSARQKYAGMEGDDGSTNSHTLWRKYDSSSGRWTSPDPYSGSMTIADPQSFNRYSYVNNDPVNLVDPTGLMLSDIGVYQTDNPALARYEEKNATWHTLCSASRASTQSSSQQQRPSTSLHEPGHGTQVVDLSKDKTITREVAKIVAESKPLSKGEAPILSGVALIVGETYTIEDGIFIDAYGNEVPGFTGTVRPIAYVPLDQGGNIILGNGMAISENVVSLSGPQPNSTPELNFKIPRGGVYIDIQSIPLGDEPTTIRQSVYVDQFPSYGGLDPIRTYRSENVITKNAATQTISISPTRPIRIK